MHVMENKRYKTYCSARWYARYSPRKGNRLARCKVVCTIDSKEGGSFSKVQGGVHDTLQGRGPGYVSLFNG